jgi:hypothetical protein
VKSKQQHPRHERNKRKVAEHEYSQQSDHLSRPADASIHPPKEQSSTDVADSPSSLFSLLGVGK